MITPIASWKKDLYVAKRIRVDRDSRGNQTQVYDTPQLFSLNVQPISEQTRFELFGANAKKMYRAIVLGNGIDINELDAVYFDGATPLDEPRNGFNANFIVRRVMKQNLATMIYFESVKG